MVLENIDCGSTENGEDFGTKLQIGIMCDTFRNKCDEMSEIFLNSKNCSVGYCSHLGAI